MATPCLFSKKNCPIMPLDQNTHQTAYTATIFVWRRLNYIIFQIRYARVEKENVLWRTLYYLLPHLKKDGYFIPFIYEICITFTRWILNSCRVCRVLPSLNMRFKDTTILKYFSHHLKFNRELWIASRIIGSIEFCAIFLTFFTPLNLSEKKTKYSKTLYLISN